MTHVYSVHRRLDLREDVRFVETPMTEVERGLEAVRLPWNRDRIVFAPLDVVEVRVELETGNDCVGVAPCGVAPELEDQTMAATPTMIRAKEPIVRRSEKRGFRTLDAATRPPSPRRRNGIR